MQDQCTLSILASQFDVDFLRLTVPHLVRMCNYPFSEKVLTIDIGNSPQRSAAVGAAGIDKLRETARQLQHDGVVDRIVEFDDAFGSDRALSKKYFVRKPGAARDHRGVPLWAWIAEFEACRTPYLVHFDCDMLLYQQHGHSWINEGIDLLQRRADVMFVLPLPGPPRADGALVQKKGVYEIDGDGFYRFKSFTCRKYLVDIQRFSQLLPVKLLYASRKRRLLQALTGRSGLHYWEKMVSRRLAASRFIRADLASKNAWTLHSHDHSERFVRELPEILRRVERGDFPDEQAGDYDLRLEYWTNTALSAAAG